jgi:hypothetical protein
VIYAQSSDSIGKRACGFYTYRHFRHEWSNEKNRAQTTRGELRAALSSLPVLSVCIAVFKWGRLTTLRSASSARPECGCTLRPARRELSSITSDSASGIYSLIGIDFLESGPLHCGTIDGGEEGLKAGPIFCRGDEGRFFVAQAFDGEELFGTGGGVVDGLAELVTEGARFFDRERFVDVPGLRITGSYSGAGICLFDEVVCRTARFTRIARPILDRRTRRGAPGGSWRERQPRAKTPGHQ